MSRDDWTNHSITNMLYFNILYDCEDACSPYCSRTNGPNWLAFDPSCSILSLTEAPSLKGSDPGNIYRGRIADPNFKRHTKYQDQANS